MHACVRACVRVCVYVCACVYMHLYLWIHSDRVLYICSFLHHNLIRKIENLQHLQYLDNLNLSYNAISKVENLGE